MIAVETKNTRFLIVHVWENISTSLHYKHKQQLLSGHHGFRMLHLIKRHRTSELCNYNKETQGSAVNTISDTQLAYYPRWKWMTFEWMTEISAAHARTKISTRAPKHRRACHNGKMTSRAATNSWLMILFEKERPLANDWDICRARASQCRRARAIIQTDNLCSDTHLAPDPLWKWMTTSEWVTHQPRQRVATSTRARHRGPWQHLLCHVVSLS
jgi:hypothetical protein